MTQTDPKLILITLLVDAGDRGLARRARIKAKDGQKLVGALGMAAVIRVNPRDPW